MPLGAMSCVVGPAIRPVAGRDRGDRDLEFAEHLERLGGEPSAVPFSSPLAPVPGGSDPLPGRAVSTRATPGRRLSRYFVTKASQEM